jgi:uncharacterized membrane protein YgaE (UPF0421/DUF939 family)
VDTPAADTGLRERIAAGLAQGAKSGVVAGICYWSSSRVGLHEGYWAAISSIVVMQADLESTVGAAHDRLIGTAIGGVLGWAAGSIWGGHAWIYGLAIGLSVLLCTAFRLGNAGRLTGVTASIIVLIPTSAPLWIVAIHRFLEVTYGIVVALAFSALLARFVRRPRTGARGSQS